PSQPFASRTDRVQVAAEARDFEALVARLAERQARSPDNLEGWVMLGRSYAFMGRHADAAESYRRALDLSDGDPEIASAYGEALTLANDGIVTPLAHGAFDAALRARPGDVRAQFYLALALEQSGELRKALDQFADLARVSPPEAPWVPALRGRIESLAQKLGLDSRQILAQRTPPEGGGFVPMPEGTESVAGLPAGEIEAIMRQRVEALAARLQDQPDDVEGWLRLARSYRVLGDLPKSRDAIAQAGRAAAKSSPEARALVTDTARQLGLGDADSPAATTGPNR
ncbi:MAG: tetratricopeptide repeat protein, partial [Alphaproteobacteria bacterium]